MSGFSFTASPTLLQSENVAVPQIDAYEYAPDEPYTRKRVYAEPGTSTLATYSTSYDCEHPQAFPEPWTMKMENKRTPSTSLSTYSPSFSDALLDMPPTPPLVAQSSFVYVQENDEYSGTSTIDSIFGGTDSSYDDEFAIMREHSLLPYYGKPLGFVPGNAYWGTYMDTPPALPGPAYSYHSSYTSPMPGTRAMPWRADATTMYNGSPQIQQPFEASNFSAMDEPNFSQVLSSTGPLRHRQGFSEHRRAPYTRNGGKEVFYRDMTTQTEFGSGTGGDDAPSISTNNHVTNEPYVYLPQGEIEKLKTLDVEQASQEDHSSGLRPVERGITPDPRQTRSPIPQRHHLGGGKFNDDSVYSNAKRCRIEERIVQDARQSVYAPSEPEDLKTAKKPRREEGAQTELALDSRVSTKGSKKAPRASASTGRRGNQGKRNDLPPKKAPKRVGQGSRTDLHLAREPRGREEDMSI